MDPADYFSGTPCALQQDDVRGRYLVAREETFKDGEVVLVSPALALAIAPTHKKRVCNACFTDFGHRLSIHCESCQQVWYCSAKCKEADMGMPGNAMPQLKTAPHTLTCQVLQHFSRCKCDGEMECVLRLAVDLLALRRQEMLNPEQSTAVAVPKRLQQYGGRALTRRPCWDDFTLLLSHADELPDKDRADWTAACKFLIKALKQAGWDTQHIPSPEEALHVLGRILSNNFSMQVPSKQAAQPSSSSTAQQSANMAEGQTYGQTNSTCESSEGAAEGPSQGLSDAVEKAQSRGRSLVYEDRSNTEAETSSAPQGTSEAPSEGPFTAAVPPALPASPTALRVNRSRSVSPQVTAAGQLMAGRMLFSTASYFNHSCEPNCVLDTGLRVGTVTALHAIKADEPLNISYIELEQPRSARQTYLKRNFFFTCACSRCEAEAQQGSQKCTYAKGNSSGSKDGKSFAPKKRGRKARISR